MHRAVLLLVLVAAAAMAPPAQPGRLSAVNPWLSACDLSDIDLMEPYGEHERVCDDIPVRERDLLLSTTYFRHCRERSLLSALSEKARNDAIGGGVPCQRVLGEVKAVDAIAARASQDLDFILARYDCGQTFSVIHTCSNCQEAYRRWVCSVLLPLFVSAPLASPQPHKQPPPASPPRKRSTTRDNYKLYASNNKNTKLKGLAGGGYSNYASDTNNKGYGYGRGNANNKPLTKTKDKSNDNVAKYDTLLLNDNLYRNSDYETIYNSLIVMNESESEAGAGTADEDQLVLMDEEAFRRYSSHSEPITSQLHDYTHYEGVVYTNASARYRNRIGITGSNVNVNVTRLGARATEQPWNERTHARSEQRAADVRRDLDNRLGSASPAASASARDRDSESERRKRRRRNTTSAETGRHRLRPCLAVCQDVERTCPYFLPGDRAPSYPTQYAGEPTFLCLDPNIEETGEQLLKSNYGDADCCYVYCGGSGEKMCTRCRRQGAGTGAGTGTASLPSQEQPSAPHCSPSPASPNTPAPPTPMSSQQPRTTSPNLVIILFGLSVSCVHILRVTANITITTNNFLKDYIKSEYIRSYIKPIHIYVSRAHKDYYEAIINNVIEKCSRLMTIIKCFRL